MAVIDGDNLVIFLDDVAIAATKSCKLKIDQDTEEITTKDSSGWKEYMKADKGWSVECEALADPTGTLNREQLLDAIINSSTDPVIKLTVPGTPASGDIVLTGDAIFTSYEESADHASPVGLSGSWMGNGILTMNVTV